MQCNERVTCNIPNNQRLQRHLLQRSAVSGSVQERQSARSAASSRCYIYTHEKSNPQFQQ
jgi:hypothetical protein